MYLLILLLIFGTIGYLLAGSERVDRAGSRVTQASRSWADRAEGWVQARFSRKSQVERFQDWAAVEKTLPREFKDWFGGLPQAGKADFTRALSEYAESLGYNLDQLVRGGLDDQPMVRQVFVESIVVYSDAYRKARKAQEEQAKQEAAEDGEKDKKKPAARKGKKAAETEAVSAG